MHSVKQAKTIVDNLLISKRFKFTEATCRNTHKRLSPQKIPMLECGPYAPGQAPLFCLLSFHAWRAGLTCYAADTLTR